MDLQCHSALRAQRVLVQRVYGMCIDCASRGLAVCFTRAQITVRYQRCELFCVCVCVCVCVCELLLFCGCARTVFC